MRMITLAIGRLSFTFPDTWLISKYDEWSFYRNRFSRFAKAVDLLAVSPNGALFLIEVKDYRQYRRSKVISLADEVTKKVLDTLAAMLPCKVNGDELTETHFSAKVLVATSLRVVLHLEQSLKHSKLFPRTFDRANVAMEMRQRLKPIDAHPTVIEMNDMRGFPWTVQSV